MRQRFTRIGNSLLALARDPSAYHDARTVDSGFAVDELLRFDSPLQMFERWVLDDTEVAGLHLEKGSKVGLLFGSANHDESVFSDSEHLDLFRTPNPHVSFGAGLHYCVGAPLAKVELEAGAGEVCGSGGHHRIVNVSDRIDRSGVSRCWSSRSCDKTGLETPFGKASVLAVSVVTVASSDVGMAGDPRQ